MGVPTWTVEVAFASEPLDTTPTWVDISSYVMDEQGISIRRGRRSPLDDFATGTATFRLRNTTRLFDPLYSSGTYYGNLLPGKQVRIRATANAVTTDQFVGFVRGWPQSFDDAGEWAYVDVECYDGLGWLSEARATDDPVYDYAATAGSASLGRFWRQVSGSTWYDAFGGERSGTLLGTVRKSSGPTGDAVSFDGTTMLRAPAASVTPPYATSFWFRSSNTTTNSYITARNTLSGNTYWYLELRTDGRFRASAAQSGVGALVVDTAEGGWNDGEWHHVVVVGEASGDWSIYMDGAAQAQNVITDTGGVAALDMHVFGGLEAFTFALTPSFIGEVADVATWSDYLTAAEALRLYELTAGLYTETTTVTAGRILDDVGWPAAWRALTATPYGECVVLPPNNAQASNLLTEVERTEQGRMFVDKSGNVTLWGRYYTTQATRGNTIQATFTDDGNAADITYSSSGYDYDADDVLNAVTVKTASDSSSTATNSTSITAYGRKSETISTLLPDTTDALSMAQGVVLQRKDVLTRVRTVRPSISQTDANHAILCGLEIGDRVRLEMTPSGVGSQLQQSATVEGIEIDAHLTHTYWAFDASPIPAVTWFTVGSSTLDGAHVVAF